MDDSAFESLEYINSSGETVYLSNQSITKFWELRGRSGFTAPEVDLITQEYASGITKILKRKILPRTVSINMIVTGDTPAQRDKLFFDMVSGLIDSKGDGIGRLYIKRSDGRTVYLNCAYSSGMKIVEEYRKFHRFTIDFYAADPFFYKDLPDFVIETAAENYLLAGLPYVGTHYVGEIESVGDGVFQNYTSEVIQPIIKVSGASSSMVIRNQTNGDLLAFQNLAIGEYATLVIDTRDGYKSIYVVYPDGTKMHAGQYLDWSSRDFKFDLDPGDNLISYYGAVPSMIKEVTFEISERYLSA